jgi:hypothetical protein
MKYLLYFALDISWQGSCIVYDPQQFTEKPISLSVPDLVEIFTNFTQKFREVGIVEKQKENKILIKEKGDEHPIAPELFDSSNNLQVISGRAHICKLETLKSEDLELFYDKLVKYLQKCCLKISTKNFLSKETSLCFAGLREVMEIRNYLAQYTKSKRKMFKNGYLYIQVL